MADLTAMGSHNQTVPINSAKEHQFHSNSKVSQCQPDGPQREQPSKEEDEVIKEAFGN